MIRVEELPYASTILKRHGLIAMRIAAVLTALRQEEEDFYSGTRYCTDTDLQTALSIIDVCLEHTLLLSSSVKRSDISVLPLRPFFKLHLFLDMLPENFTYSQMREIAVSNGYSVSTVKRNLKN